MCIYYDDAFLWLKIVKMVFLFSVNVCVFITMMLFYCLKWGFYLVLMHVYLLL